jgi:hypothetical protein
LSTTGKLIEKVILKTVQGHIEERGLLSASQFGFRDRHRTTLQCVRLMDNVTLKFNHSMSRLRNSWILKKPVIQRGTSACYIDYLI